MPCKALTAASKPCRAPETLVDVGTGYCQSHDPALVEERRQRGIRGGYAAAERFKRQNLRQDELGELRTPEDVRRWLELIGRAVACGTLSASAGAWAVRACEACLKALDAGAMASEIKELRKQLAEFRKLRAS